MRSELVVSSLLLPFVASALPTIPSIRKGEVSNTVQMQFNKRTSHRANALAALDKRQVSATLVPNNLPLYSITVSIGTPPQTFDLVLDTGSSDIWTYAPESSSECSNCTDNYFNYTQSSTLQDVNDLGIFNISYGSANSGVTGFYAMDIVSVGGVKVNQTIAVATTAHEGDPPNGIFGIGPSKNEASYDNSGAQFPTFTDTLVAAGLINSTSFSVWLDDLTAADITNGSILFGGYDSSKYTGDMVTFPIIIPAPNTQVTLDIAEPSISYNLGSGNVTVPPVNDMYAVLLDTGTSITRLPVDQVEAIANGTNATFNQTDGVYLVDCSLANSTGGIDLAFASTNGTLTINIPWAELTQSDPSLPSDTCILGVIPTTEDDAQGLYIFGDTFLRSMYMYFDYDNGIVGLAQAKYNHTTPVTDTSS